MPHKGKVAPEVKIRAVEDYLSGNRSHGQILDELGIHKSTLKDWATLYKNRGPEGLCPVSRQQVYSRELKMAAIQDYYEHGISIAALCEKYNVSNTRVVRLWLKSYNDHVTFRNRYDGGTTYMVKGRKASLEERIEIVQFCIANEKNYNHTSDKYQVSYQQVYGWVKKYEESGVQGLEDRRGRAKPKNSMTTEDILRAENKMLAAKLKESEMENELLKKSKR